jgi:gliding motility-associated-like protein
MKKEFQFLTTYLCVLSTLFSIQLNAQSINVQQTLTPKQMVEQVLAGQGVVISNVKYNGSIASAQSTKVNVSYFDNNGIGAFPITNGVLLTTGNGLVAKGPNNQVGATNSTGTSVVNDPDLNAIGNNDVTNGVVLEFDFIPSGDSISFKYFFASEEYPEFSNPPVIYMDAFGFFISGPGISGPYQNGGQNIAVLNSPPAPANTPVNIANVSPYTNSSQYVANNSAGSPLYNAMQYDGRTIRLTARASVQCGQTYHIKLAIANVSDQSYDTGVFLEANSFKANVVSFSTKLGAISDFTDTLLAEGCVSSTLQFVRPHPVPDSAMTYIFNVGGTFDPNADIIPIGDTVHFGLGQDTVEVTIAPIADGISEADESIIITGYSITPCGDTIYNSVTLWITDHYNFTYSITPNPAKVVCLTDSALVKVDSISGSIPPFKYLWSTSPNDTLVQDYLFPDTNKHDTINYYVKVTDGCGWSVIDTVPLIVDQDLTVDTTYSMPTPCGEAKGAVVAQVSGITGPANGTEYTWKGPGKDSSAATYNATVWQNLSSGWYYFKVKDQVCTAYDSAFVNISNPPVAQVSGTPLQGNSPLTVSFNNSSQNASTYFWYYGDGDTLSVNNLGGQTHTYTTSEKPYEYSMYLVAIEGSCTDTAYLTITIPDVIPPMVIQTANVFTPNGDGANDTWHFSVFENVKNISVTITNRWGNVVYTHSGATAVWDGKDQKGQMVNEGTYFYIFDVTDFNDKHQKGQGMIQVVRN